METQWRLRLYPEVYTKYNTTGPYLSVYLYRIVKKDETDVGVTVKGSFYVLNVDNQLKKYGKDQYSKLVTLF